MAEQFLFTLSVVIIFSISRIVCVDYVNNTIDFEKIVEDFTLHQSRHERGDRNGRNGRLISFDTRNDNIEVYSAHRYVFNNILVNMVQK